MYYDGVYIQRKIHSHICSFYNKTNTQKRTVINTNSEVNEL